MRRGRTGLGGWRNENPRYFRPRGGGTPHYRPPRNYGLLDAPRFPPPGPRLNRPPHFSSRPNHGERGSLEHNERNQYRSNHQNNQHILHNRSQYRDKSVPRQTYPYNQQIRYKENDTLNPNSSNYYKDGQNVQSCLVNNTVNIDHRNAAKVLHNDNYEKQNLNSTWSIPVLENKRHYYEDQSPSKMYRQPGSNNSSKIAFLDYPGHRPPSSDYYGGNPSPVTNNNTSFSRSVDDTVDIVRKRLLNRNESQTLSEDCVSDQSYNASDTSRSYQKNENETPVKKKILRQKQAIKSNCDKMKNKIVHQLFKMDKDKIHKLMDNPNSSTKFEYAISSLITESQISLNRHLRSVAEKSLCSSSSEFIQNNSNTIYEDTFMKQMQCILDPQDTILLEDMKPLVMAELSKFLQIEEYDPNYDVGILEDHVNYQPKEEITECQYDELYQSNEHSRKKYSDDQTAELLYSNIEHYSNKEFDNTYQEIKPLYERRTAIKCHDYSEERRQSSENRRKSLENKSPLETSPKSLPLFEPSREQLTEEEDPFAELDKQYHVPVDHNFIQTDIYASLEQSSTNIIKPDNFDNQIVSPSNSNSIIVPNHNNNNDYESNMQSINMSPLILPIPNCNEANDHAASIPLTKIIHCDKKSPEKITMSSNDDDAGQIILNKLDTKCENISRTKYIEKKEPDKNEVFSTPIKSCTHSNSRKRSMDQRPSHRKEKRKKCESKPAPSKPKLPYKNSDVNLCHSKSPEKDKNSKKSFIYSYFSKNRGERGITKGFKKVETTDKTYSDKYVRRKEVPKNKENELSKKRNSDSLASPKENSNSNSSGLTPIKSDTKVKLKPIDMFEEQSKKVHLHQAHRNTALPTLTPNKTVKASIKNMTTSQNIKCVEKVIKKLFSRETQTYAGKSSISKFCQTENKQFVVKAVQTDPVFFERFKSDSTDTFERMKEIDLEIQVLLQEKFKLYSSLENKDSCQNSMQTLGMTVLNVTAVEEARSDEVSDNVTEVSADTIVDDFTNIPVEELEQIALESLSEDKDTEQVKRTRRPTNRMLGHRSSFVTRRCTKKANPPNISLLEQIITDDRPLEDIILLDELENCSVKKKPQLTKKKATKRSRKFLKKKINLKNFVLKDCSVVLEKINIDKHLIENFDDYNKNESDALSNLIIDNQLPDIGIQETTKEAVEIQPETQEIMEEDNNIQFDMLDVSEDIVIGDNCEVKDHGKDLNERIDVPITEEIILDNSQSSCDDLTAPESGQGENECKMYDYSTDENLRRDSITVTGNADAVLALECVDNNFIAASLDGNVYHFNSDGQLINTLRGSNLAVTCLTIVKEKYGTTVYTGSLDSRIRYYDLETGVEKGPECNVLSPIQTMDRAWDTIFVGTRTGFVLQFECKNNMLIPVSTVKFSEQSILALRAMKEGPRKVLLVAARSENVTIKDAQTGLLLRTLMGPKMTVYTLLFEDGKVYCGTSSHQIHVFEYSTGGHVGSHEGGKGAVCLRATGGLLFAGCYDGCVYVYREGETRPLAQLRGPSLMLLSLAVVGSKIIAGYKDRSLYIWKIPLNILQEMIL